MPQLSEILTDTPQRNRLSSITGVSSVKPLGVDDDSIFDSLPDWVKFGYNESITGLSQKLLTGEKPFEIENYNPSVMEDIGASIVSFLMPTDWLTFGGFAKAGKAVFNASKMATKQMVKAGVKQSTAEQIAGKGAEKIINNPAMKELVAEGATTGAFGLGGYTGIATAMRQMAEEEGVDLGEVVTQAGKSAILGAVTGGIGGRAVKKGTSGIVKVGQETLAFGGLGALLEGEDPFDPMSYVHSAGVILGMKGARAAPKVVKEGAKAVGRVATGQAPFQRQLEPKKITPEKAEALAKVELEIRQAEKLEREVWTSKKGKKKTVKILRDEEVDGKRFFVVQDVKSDNVFKVQKGNFFKFYEVGTKPLTEAKIRSSRVGQIKGLERELKVKDEISQANKRLITGDKTSERISLKDFSAKQLFKYRKQLQYERDLSKLKKEYGEKFVDYQPKKNIVERIFPEKWVKPLFAAETNAKKSPEGKILTGEIQIADARAKELFGTFNERMNVESGLHGIKSKKLRQQVADALAPQEAEGRKITPEAKKIAKKIRPILNEMFRTAEKSGIKVADYVENYFPRMWKTEVAEIIYNDISSIKEKHRALLGKNPNPEDVQSLDRLIRASVDTEFSPQTKLAFNRLTKKGMTYKEAMDALTNDIHREMYSPFGNIEKSRIKDLPSEFFERDAGEVLARYNMKLSRRIAFAEQWGEKGTKAHAKIKSLASKDPEGARLLSQIFSSFTGLIEIDPAKNFSPKNKKFMHDLMAFEMSTKIALGFATIPNITQFTISTAAEAGYWRFLKGAWVLATDKEVRKRIRKSGATHYNLLDIMMGTDIRLSSGKSLSEAIKRIKTDKANRMSNVASLLAKVSGFKGINALNQMLAASTAEIYVRDLHKIANTSSIGSRREWAKNNLRRLGVKDFKKKLSESDVEHAMFRFAKESQLQKDVLKDPLIFNDPRFRPLFIFKRFGFRQAKYVKDLMKREIAGGNLFVPLRMAAGGLLGAEFVISAKDWLMKFMSGEDVYREHKEGIDALVDKWAMVGSLGFFSDILDAEDKLSAVKFAVNPVFLSDLEQMYKGLRGLAYNIDTFGVGKDAISRSIKEFAPVFGGFARQAAKRFETPGQKEKRISVRKGRVRTKIFEAMLEGKHKSAYGTIKNWNKANPSNPFTAEDINEGEIYQFLARKQKIKAKP